MSQLFDSLRRGRATPARAKTPRTAGGDAVLATLGYAPVHRRRRRSSVPLLVAIALRVLGVGWIGWQFYDRTAANPVTRRNTPPSASISNPSAPPAPRTSTPLPEPVVPAAVSSAPPLRPLPSVTRPEAQVPPFPRPQATARATPAPSRAASSPVPVTRPETVPAARSTAVNDLDLALYYHRAGDFENALQHYRALLQKNELDAQAHNNLGLLYQEKSLLQESARELQRATLIEPRNAGAHNNYGVTLLMQGKIDEGEAEFRSALALDSRNLDALVNLALAQRTAGQLDVAKETLLKVLTIEPRNAPAHYNLAQLYDQTHEPARAVEHYRKFLETAAAEHAGRVAAVRARIAVLSRTPE